MSSLSPLQLIAGAELANNTGIAVNAILYDAIDNYRSTDLIKPFANVMSSPQLSTVGSLVSTLITLTATTCPALSDSTPSDYAANIGIILANSASAGNSVNGFTSLITELGNTYLGTGDNSVFVQAFVAAEAYINSNNNFLLTTNNSNTYLGSSFTTQNDLITGNLSEVNLAFPAFGQDLQALGQLINLENLATLGSPVALLRQISNVARLTPKLINELDQANIEQDVVFTPPGNLAGLLTLEKTLYTIYQRIAGQDLKEILKLLNVRTPNIQTMADLLNPYKLFPNSFLSLTVRTVDGLRGIYLDSSGSVNLNLLQLLPKYVVADYTKLAQTMPQDQVLANQALRVSLQQIKNIFNLTLPELAQSYLGLVTTKDLPLINALTQPVPDSVVNFYKNNFSTGSGPEGTLVIGDVFGAAAGTGYIRRLANTISVLDSISTSNSIVDLQTVYQRMDNTLANVYGDPVAGPVVIPAGLAAGTYTSTEGPLDPMDPMSPNVIIETAAANAFGNGLIPNALSSVSTVVVAEPTAVGILNNNWNTMASKLISEHNNQIAASINFNNLIPNEKTAVLSFIQNLPNYGTDTTIDGSAEFLEGIADKNTLGGQAIIGSLRQGRNVAVLNAAGIGYNIDIPATPNQPPTQIDASAAEYSESDAAALVIK